jgi:hypothetical protein
MSEQTTGVSIASADPSLTAISGRHRRGIGFVLHSSPDFTNYWLPIILILSMTAGSDQQHRSGRSAAPGWMTELALFR